MLLQSVTSAAMLRELKQTLVIHRSRNHCEVVLRQFLDNLADAYSLRPPV